MNTYYDTTIQETLHFDYQVILCAICMHHLIILITSHKCFTVFHYRAKTVRLRFHTHESYTSQLNNSENNILQTNVYQKSLQYLDYNIFCIAY